MTAASRRWFAFVFVFGWVVVQVTFWVVRVLCWPMEVAFGFLAAFRRRCGGCGCLTLEFVVCRWWVGVDPVGSPLGFGWRLYWREHWCSLLFWVEVRIQIHFGVGLLAAAFLSPTFVVFPYCLAALFLFLIWFKFTVVFLLFCWRLHSLCDVSALGGWRVIAN